MTDPRNDTADIAWLKTLAEQGAKTPYRGASVMISAGVIYGTASLLHWGHASSMLPGGMGMVGIEWLAATVLFLLSLPILIWRLKSQPGVKTTANRVVATVWACVGWGIFALFASMMVNDYRMGAAQGMGTFWLVPSIIMVFYGVGWAATASLYGAGRLWWLSIGSFVSAPVLAALSGSPEQYLAYAACLFGLMALPGVLLVRAANRG
jgi:hypothetical protein